jgi:hypothetical protein
MLVAAKDIVAKGGPGVLMTGFGMAYFRAFNLRSNKRLTHPLAFQVPPQSGISCKVRKHPDTRTDAAA